MTNINPKIFKRYDIRGKFPDEINSEVIKQIVAAYVQLFNPTKIIIGHDPLTGSSEIYPHICSEFTKYGVEVYKVGQITTPMLYFASAHYQVPQGIMLTASHLGPGHTGVKIVNDGVPPEPSQIIELRDLILNEKCTVPYSATPAQEHELTELFEDYTKKILEVVGQIPNPTRYKIVYDSSNGPNGPAARFLFEKLGLNFVALNEEIRGKNLSHDTNPKIEVNRRDLMTAIKAEKADLGIIWDGDCDRAYFLDSEGKVISPEFVGIQVGSLLIKEKKGNKMTIDIRAAQAVENEISKIGGVVKRIQAWHVPIKFEMHADSDVVFGMETSGHMVFRDMFKSDDGLLASLMFVKGVFSMDITLQTALEEFSKKYKIVEEINFETAKSEEALVQEFKLAFPNGVFSDIDGATVDYPDWRFNARSSRTEPIIRLNISGTNFARVDENLAKISQIIGGKVLS
jgi:phosphomannomutase